MGYKQYWVYMMTNRWHSVLYIGVTNSLEKRVCQHKNKVISGFTEQYNCDRLVYFEIYDEITQAVAREKQLKKWSRPKKELLIAQMNPQWDDLAADWYREGVIPSEVEGSPPSHDAGDPSTPLGMTRGVKS
ncbi:MAG TPA: GIY-YIG nuclease family protein [Thermoanaerobaculia bacterium]|nr:GIY-YIG nuclease family protein [Thermoanaerobaculia bacterium]